MTGDQLEPPPAPESPWQLVDVDDQLVDEQLVDVDQLEARAGLFAAPESADGGAAMFDPVPIVIVNGVRLDQAPVGDALVVLDGVTVTWGREDVLNQPEPATGSLQLWDPTARWATGVDRRGQSVELRWRGEHAPGAFTEVTYFRGRIGSPITVARETKTLPDGRDVTGALVDVPLEGSLVDLANRVPTVAWPAETLGARATRIQTEILNTGQTATPTGYVPPAPVSQVIVRDYWKTPGVYPVDLKDQVSLLDHLVALYDTCGADRMSYLPDTRQTTALYRKTYPAATRGTAGLVRFAAGTAGQARAGKGAFIRSYAFQNTLTGTAGLNLYLDAQALEYEPADGITSPARVTRVQVSHKDQGPAQPYTYADRTVEKRVAGTDEAQAGVRTARLESLVAWNAWADLTMDNLEAIVREEGSQWVLQPLRLSTRDTGGFESLNHARFVLNGAETDTSVFIQRSWLPELRIRPLYGVQGGVITYEAGGWDVELQLVPVVTTGKQHAITWEEIDDGTPANTIELWDDDHPLGLHESVTLEDLGYCATGLGVTTAAMGLDYGWDTVQ